MSPVDAVVTTPDEVKRLLGDVPVVVELTTGAATVEVAARGKDATACHGPYRSVPASETEVGGRTLAAGTEPVRVSES